MSFSSVENLIANLRAKGFTFELIGGQLAVKPKDRLTDEMRLCISKNKENIATLLRFEKHSDEISLMLSELNRTDTDALIQLQNETEERSAIFEFDAGLSREDADTKSEVTTLLAWFDKRRQHASKQEAA